MGKQSRGRSERSGEGQRDQGKVRGTSQLGRKKGKGGGLLLCSRVIFWIHHRILNRKIYQFQIMHEHTLRSRRWAWRLCGLSIVTSFQRGQVERGERETLCWKTLTNTSSARWARSTAAVVILMLRTLDLMLEKGTYLLPQNLQSQSNQEKDSRLIPTKGPSTILD